MEVHSKNDGRITNVELLEILEERKEKRSKRSGGSMALKSRDMMEERTIKYLKESTMGAATSEMVNACFQRFKEQKWDLTEAELLQIANHVPKCEPEIYMIIEQCEARFSEDDVKEILDVIEECFKL
jgi:DNA-directed RNA polymerase subunit F